eukprot:TRINITY_DN4356_c0_g3_i1.p1 TRINITY_DN4356_c0_g3~~TRINITY_DN4356_c0_g3_i1.p1  ORF type:complete len:551 (-),score=102.59 TRINITY_DN4356_c0_g3_i1:193-1845(-)
MPVRPASAPAFRHRLQRAANSEVRAGRGACAFGLPPSVAPTSRVHRPGQSSRSAAHVVVPSLGASNNPSRAKNAGNPLLLTSLRQSVSSPSTGNATYGLEASPRCERSTARKASKVNVQYPSPPSPANDPMGLSLAGTPLRPGAVGRQRPSSAPSGGTRPQLQSQQQQPSFTGSPNVKAKQDSSGCPRTPGTKRATFGDNHASEAMRRSMKRLNSLNGLRRVKSACALGSDPVALTQHAPLEKSDAEATVDASTALATPPMTSLGGAAEVDILHATLMDLNDSVDSLLRFEKGLEDAQEPVAESGAAFHATSHIYGRALLVVRRKRELLLKAEQRTATLVASQQRRDIICAELMAGSDPSMAADGLLGVRKFVQSLTHRNGNPADADKSDFSAFVAAFGLPARHMALRRLRELSLEYSAWWAATALREAERGGADIEAIARVAEVAVGTGASRDNPRLIKAYMVAAQAMRAKFLPFADAAASGSGAVRPPVGQATLAADAIEVVVKRALADCGSVDKDLLAQAEVIVKDLRNLEAQWKRLAGRERRLAQK